MCTKEGPVGPTGPQGSEGNPGVPGSPGVPGPGSTLYITTDTTWSSDKNLNYSVFVDAGATLTILPGVTVSLYPYCDIEVYGKIVAIGNSGNWIKFRKGLSIKGGLIAMRNGTNAFSYCDIDSIGEINLWKSMLNIDNSKIKRCNYTFYGSDINLRVINCDMVSNINQVTSFGPSVVTYFSNNYIAYNNGSSIVTLCTNTADTNTPQQYSGLSQSIKTPRAIPNF